MIAQGRYRAKITSQGMSQAKSGTPQFFLVFQLTGKYDPATPSEPVDCEPVERTYYRAITDTTFDYFEQDLDRLGFTGDGFAAIELSSPNCCDLRGNDIDVVCRHEVYQGRTVERFSLGGGGAPPAPATAQTIRDLDARFGKRLKAKASKAQPLGVKSKSISPAEAKAVAETATDDDSPF